MDAAALVAVDGRHRDGEEAETGPRRLDEQFRLDLVAVGGERDPRQDLAADGAESALAVGDPLPAEPGDPPGHHPVGGAADPRHVPEVLHPVADDDADPVLLQSRQQAREMEESLSS